MAEYIKRKEAILTVKGYVKHAIDKGRKCLDAEDDTIHMCDEIDRLLAVDVIPRPRWIPIAEHLPEPETEVMIACNRNGYRFIATAIHEDGTLLTEGSKWNWNEIWAYGRYDEEHDDYIIPEGWWENRCFTPDDVYNCPVDCEVTHWMPMPELPKEEDDGDK